MRLNTLLTVTIVLVSMFSLAGCDKVAAITGGPADGHDGPWYKAHYAEAKAEADYCTKKYQGPNSTPEDLAKMPNFCTQAYQAIRDHEAPLKNWANMEAVCKTTKDDIFCVAAVKTAKEVDTNSKEAQDMLAKEMVDVKNRYKGVINY